MDTYEKKYKEALERARIWKDKSGMPKDKQGILDDIFPELKENKESDDERIRKALIRFYKSTIDIDGIKGNEIVAWLEKQGEKQQKTPIWKHWKDGIAGNGEGKSIYLIKSGNTYSLSSCLCFECDYIELSELDKLLYEKQGQARKITHEEICKSYGIPDIGEFSDGYHTFNGLYKQRMILFAVLVKTYKDKAWKSWKHEDGLDCFGGGWFIVGIDTPAGTYTYHYEAKDWDRFDCKVLEKAKHWDGHDESDVERLFSLVSNTNKDEVIKCLINGMKFYYEDNEEATWGTEKFSMKVKDILSWLEKQGEQKPFDYENANIQQKDFAPKVELKFKKGDWIISNNKQSTYQVIEVKRGIYVIRDNADNHEFYIGIEECEKSGRLFTIQDAKDGDVLYSPCLELLWIFKNRDSVYCGCNLSYNNGAFCGEGYFKMPTDAIPATKEQHDTLMKAMTDAGWEFDFDKKELKKISQRMVSAEAKEAMYDKPTDEEMKELLRTEYEKGRADAIAEMQKGWSEEDERNLRLTEYAVMKFFGGDCSLVGWLRKSLKDRYTWKPSEEQMEALEHFVRSIGESGYASPYDNNTKLLYLLLEQLKKLREE